MAAPDTGGANVHPLITKGLRGRPRSGDALDLSSNEKAELIADICIGSGSETYFGFILPEIEGAETAHDIVILLHHEREHLKTQLQIAEEQGKHVKLEHNDVEQFLALILKGETIPYVPLSAEPEEYAAPGDQPGDSSVKPSESKLAEAFPITSSASHSDSEGFPTDDGVEVTVNGRSRSASDPPSPTTSMSSATASPTESAVHRTPVGPTRPLPFQQHFKRQQLRRLSTGSSRLMDEPTGKAAPGSQSAVITSRRLNDEINGPAKGWSNGKPPWSREGATLVRSSTAPSPFVDRRPSLPTSASMERLNGSRASSPTSKGSPTYKGWPFRQPDNDADNAPSLHGRRPSNSLLLDSAHVRRDSSSSITSVTGSPGLYSASRDNMLNTLRREVEELKVQIQLKTNNLHNIGQEQDSLQMQLEAKSEEAERLNNNLRTAEKLYKSKEEELSRQLQERETDFENLERELSKTKETVTTQRAKLQAAEQDKRELQATVQDRDSTSSALRKSLDRAQKELDVHKARLAELEAKRDSLEDELGTANHRLADLHDIEDQFNQARQNAEELKLRVEELQAGPGFYAVSAPSSSAPGSVSQTLGAEMLRQGGFNGAEPSSPLAPRTRKSSRRLRRPPIPPSPRPDVECLSTELEKADSDRNTDDNDDDSGDDDDNTEVDPDDSLADVSIEVPSTPLPGTDADPDMSMTSPPSYNGSPRGAEQVLEAGPSVEAVQSDDKGAAESTKVATVEAEPKPIVQQESKGVMTTDIVAATEASVPTAEVIDDKNAGPICNDPNHVNWVVLVAFIVVAFAVGVGFGAKQLSSGSSVPSLVHDPYAHIHTITSATGLPYSAWHRKGQKNVMEHRGRLRRGRVPT